MQKLIVLMGAVVACSACGDSEPPIDDTGTSLDGSTMDADTGSTADSGGMDGSDSSDVGGVVDAPVTDVAPMNCEDAVGSWKSDDDMVFVVVETGCILTNVCDLADGTHVTGTMTSTEVVLDLGATEGRFPYILDGGTFTVRGAGPSGADLILRPLGAGESIPDTCPTP